MQVQRMLRALRVWFEKNCAVCAIFRHQQGEECHADTTFLIPDREELCAEFHLSQTGLECARNGAVQFFYLCVHARIRNEEDWRTSSKRFRGNDVEFIMEVCFVHPQPITALDVSFWLRRGLNRPDLVHEKNVNPGKMVRVTGVFT